MAYQETEYIYDEASGEYIEVPIGETRTSQTTDCNGAQLNNGDSVTPIKDLKIKGSPNGLKRGEKIKNIRLTDDVELIEVGKGKKTIVLKTCYFKKL